MTLIASILTYDDVFFENLFTEEKLNRLPTKKVTIQGGQVGWEWAREACPSHIQDADSLWAALDYTTWPLRHTRDMSVTHCSEHSVTAHHYKPQPLATGLSFTYTNRMVPVWQQLAILQAVGSLDYFGFTGWAAAPSKTAHICIFGNLSHLSSQVRRRVGKVAVPPENSRQGREDAAPCRWDSEVGKGRLGCLSVCVRLRPPHTILFLQITFQHISLAALNAPVNVKWFIVGFRRIQQDDHCVGK